MKKNQPVGLVGAVYDKFASLFSATRQHSWSDFLAFEKYIERGARVLDVGCGNGRLADFLANYGVQYVGVDVSSGLIDEARRLHPKNQFTLSDMRTLPFPDASFEQIFVIASFHHLEKETDRELALREMKRVLALGGVIILTNWNLQSNWAKKKIASGKYVKTGVSGYSVPWRSPFGDKLADRYYYSFSLSELDELFTRNGFFVLENCYIKKGEKSDVESGKNILTVGRSE